VKRYDHVRIRCCCTVVEKPDGEWVRHDDVEKLQARLDRLVGLARRLERGCDCDYDYRCGNCQLILDLLEAVKPHVPPEKEGR